MTRGWVSVEGGRRRVSLGRIFPHLRPGQLFIAEVNDRGVVRLVPSTLVADTPSEASAT